jgi:integrase
VAGETVRIWGRSSNRAPGDPSTPPGVDGVQSWQAPLIEANPMDKRDRVRLPSPAPPGLGPGQVEAILVVILRGRLRDRVLFRLIAETGLHAVEALFVHVEDLDLAPGDELPAGGPWWLIRSGCEGKFEAGEVAGAGSVEWVSVPPGVEPDEVEGGGGVHVFEVGLA